jgi:hemerythrin
MMTRIQVVPSWRDSHSVGVDLLDHDHNIILNTLGVLENEVVLGRRGDVGQKIVTFLVDFTQEHFRREEQMMQHLDPAEIDSHREAHQFFVGRLADRLSGFGIWREQDLNELASLGAWFVQHIEKEDRRHVHHHARMARMAEYQPPGPG